MPICNLSELTAHLPPYHCLLGLDLGSKTIGVAVSDPGLSVASPLVVIERKKFTEDATRLAKIMKDRTVGGLVFGLPLNMDGTESPRSQSTRTFARNLLNLKDLFLPEPLIAFQDERLSTAAVQRFMIIDADMTRKRRDAVVDKMAAAWILQGALDTITNRSPNSTSA
jgi:putative holliday junction resolvase